MSACNSLTDVMEFEPATGMSATDIVAMETDGKKLSVTNDRSDSLCAVTLCVYTGLQRLQKASDLLQRFLQLRSQYHNYDNYT